MLLNYQLQPKNLIGVISVHVSSTYHQCVVPPCQLTRVLPPKEGDLGEAQRQRAENEIFLKGPERHTGSLGREKKRRKDIVTEKNRYGIDESRYLRKDVGKEKEYVKEKLCNRRKV